MSDKRYNWEFLFDDRERREIDRCRDYFAGLSVGIGSSHLIEDRILARMAEILSAVERYGVNIEQIDRESNSPLESE